jgi:histidinol phosphatase-like PHP family hydrolase
MKTSLFAGKYLFHFHTHFTDGSLAVRDYFDFAENAGIERLIFLEHIRISPAYSVEEYLCQVRETSRETGIPATVGFETKILDDGRLDISPEHLAQAEVVGLAEHGFPPDVTLWQQSLQRAFDFAGSHNGKPFVWVHPGLTLKRINLLEEKQQEYLEMVQYARSRGVLIEQNRKYDLIPQALASAAEDDLVHGVDAHRQDDFSRFKSVEAALDPAASS